MIARFLAVFMFAIFLSLALLLGYQHTLGTPSLSGLLGLYIMVIQPQIGLALVFVTHADKGK